MRRLGEPLLGLVDRRVHNLAKLTDAHAQEIHARLKEAQRESREELAQLTRLVLHSVDVLRPQIESTQQLLAAQQEAILESFAFLGRTLREAREEGAQASEHLAALRQRLDGIVRQIEAPMDPVLAGLREPGASLFAHSHSAEDPVTLHAHRFPAPALHLTAPDTVPPERRVEIPFVFHALGQLPAGASVLDLGGAASGMPWLLAGLGFNVTVMDPRAKPTNHPHVTIIDRPLEGWEARPHAYHAVVWLWAAGQAAGRETAAGRAGIRETAARLRAIAADDAILVATMPFGHSSEHRPDQVFDRAQIEHLLADWVVDVCTVVEQQSRHQWTVADSAGVEGGRRFALIKARAS